MKEEGDIKRRYQHPDAVSYTPENEDGLMLLIRPSFFCKYTGHLRCRYAEINARRTPSTPPLYFG